MHPPRRGAPRKTTRLPFSGIGDAINIGGIGSNPCGTERRHGHAPASWLLMCASDVAGPSVVCVDEPLSAQTLREQAQTYAAVAETESDLNSNTFVLFRFGGEHFAIALDDLDEFAICTVAAAAYRWTGSTPSSTSTRGFFSCARPRPRVPQFDAPVSPSMPAPPCHCSAFPGYDAAMSTIFESSRVVDALRPLIVPALQRGAHPAHDPQSAIATSPTHGSQR